MKQTVFYPAGDNPALLFASRRLQDFGCAVAAAPSMAVTHLLLGVPCRDTDEQLEAILAALPETVTVVGGNLDRPLLSGYKKLDLLQDESYLARNAAITADCALQVARSQLPVVLEGCSALILGWGRIGKLLARLLRANGAAVTVAARKEQDLAMLRALGYGAESIGSLKYSLRKHRLILNTVPYPVLNQEQLAHCRRDCVKIELASAPGIQGEDVVQARGLPGKMAPESAGALIASSIIRLILEQED